MLEYLIQQIINGISLGSIYGLIAIGYTMVYGIIGMINFAHGDIFMSGAFLAVMAFLLLTGFGFTWIPLAIVLTIIMAMFFTSFFGWTLERIAYRPLRHSFRLAPLITAIGASIVLQNFVQITQGAKIKAIQPVLTGGFSFEGSGDFVIQLSYMNILIVFITLVILAIFTYLIAKTPLGRSQRACEQDKTMAALLGVDVNRTIALTFIIGASLASVAGFMYLFKYGVIDFYIGFVAGIKAFTAAVLGGIGSLPGAMLGGLIIGLVETVWSAFFPIEYKDVAAFSILVIVLIFMPSGFLGKPEIEKI